MTATPPPSSAGLLEQVDASLAELRASVTAEVANSKAAQDTRWRRGLAIGGAALLAVVTIVAVLIWAVVSINNTRKADEVAACHYRNVSRIELRASFDGLFVDLQTVLLANPSETADQRQRTQVFVADLQKSFDDDFRRRLPVTTCH